MNPVINNRMKPFKLFVERKQRNPLRKDELISSGVFDYFSPENIEKYRRYYREYPVEKMDNVNDRTIRKKYHNLLKSSEELANQYLDSEIKKEYKDAIRIRTKPFKKIYEYQGVQVFLDEENVENTDYTPGSYNYRIVRHSVLVMLVYTRDILPNRKPKILITSLKKHPYTKTAYDPKNPSAGMAGDRLIFIDENYVDNDAIWVHEYAHWVAGLIPKQTKQMLINSFEKFIELYYNKEIPKEVTNKKTNGNKKPVNPLRRGKELSIRQKGIIAKKLGFPEYGLTNHDEFFAVLIENWKQLPNTKLTYRFKSLVKNVINRC
jgi:hypothetical protein